MQSSGAGGQEQMMAKGTVLVVDDDLRFLQTIREVLQEDGYEVATTVGAQAVDVAAALRPDVILLDVMMPGMNGMDVSQHLRHGRREAGLTRHQLARRAGVSYGYICQIEANRAGLPREQQLRALAAALAPSPDDVRMLLNLANQTRVPAHVVHAVLRQNPVVAALLWWLRDHPLPEHGSALMQQLMAPAHTDAGAARGGEQNQDAQVTEVPLPGGAAPA